MSEEGLSGRSVPEWIGATPDTAIPLRVRIRVFERFGGVCQLSKRKIMPGDAWQADHILAVILGGPNRESNLHPVLSEPHKAKTKRDVQVKAKIARTKAKHLGQWPKSRGFNNSKYIKKINGQVVLRDET